jgi:hypothetical protein
LVVVAMVVHQVMSRQHHTVAVDTELVLVMVMHHYTNPQHHTVLELVVFTEHQLVLEAKDMMLHHHHSVHNQLDKHMQRMLKVFIKIQIHKSFVVQLQVVYKPIHKTLEFAFFNHHLSHPQAHSLFEKFAHLNHHHHHFAFVNKLLLFLNLLHLFFVNVHHNHHNRLLAKLSFVAWQHYLFHHDLSLSNVYHLFHLVLVMLSSNDGSHMEHKPNVVQLYNVPALLNNMLVHVMLSFNTKLLKYASFVNSNDSVLLKLAHKLIFNNMVLNFSMLVHFFNKLVLLVSLKTFHLQLVLVALL